MDDTTRILPVILTQDEFDRFAAELAATNQEIEALVLERKAAATAIKGKIEEAQGRQSRLTTIVAKRSEEREVGCEQRINPEAKLVATMINRSRHHRGENECPTERSFTTGKGIVCFIPARSGYR